jgi:Flp pilus assembly protein TadG
MPRLLATRADRRRGTLSVEALFVLPLFLLVVLGAVGIADLVVSEQLVDEAAGRAARAAALGGSPEEVSAAVRAVLGEARANQTTVTVRGTDGKDPSEVPPGGLLEVRVAIPARHATTTGLAPVPGDELLLGRTVMQRE